MTRKSYANERERLLFKIFEKYRKEIKQNEALELGKKEYRRIEN